MEAITEVYEPQWGGSEALYAQASSIEVLWQGKSSCVRFKVRL